MILEDFFTLTEMKNGLATLGRVEELISIMQQRKDSATSTVSDSSRQWSSVASTLVATENQDCLSHFVKLNGLSYLNRWLQESLNFGNDIAERAVEESLIALLGSLERLPISGEDSAASGIQSTVEQLVGFKSVTVGKKARALSERWKNALEKTNQITPASSSNSANTETHESSETHDSSINPTVEVTSSVTFCSKAYDHCVASELKHENPKDIALTSDDNSSSSYNEEQEGKRLDESGEMAEEKNRHDFDLNEVVCADEESDCTINRKVTAPIAVAASKRALVLPVSGGPQFGGGVGWKGSAATSAFHTPSPRRTSSGRKRKADVNDFDLNVVGTGDDDDDDAQDSGEASSRRGDRLRFDLNCLGDEDEDSDFDLNHGPNETPQSFTWGPPIDQYPLPGYGYNGPFYPCMMDSRGATDVRQILNSAGLNNGSSSSSDVPSFLTSVAITPGTGLDLNSGLVSTETESWESVNFIKNLLT